MHSDECKLYASPGEPVKKLCLQVSEKISPAKAQSAAAFLNGFLCAFAPLREKSSLVRFQTGQVTERAEAGKEKVGAAFDSHKSLQVVNARA